VPGPNRENDQYLCVGVIGFALFYDFSIGCWTVYCLSSFYYKIQMLMVIVPKKMKEKRSFE
jgi:hypothetical protein